MPRMENRRSALRLAAGMLALVCATAVAPTQVFAQDQIHSLAELSELPKLADSRQAARSISDAYPRRLQRNNVAGRVQLKFVVNADGKVDASSIEVMAAAVEALGEAAREAAIDFEFVPGKIDGNPVRTAVVFPISFGVSE
jgi:TonB family protein